MNTLQYLLDELRSLKYEIEEDNGVATLDEAIERVRERINNKKTQSHE